MTVYYTAEDILIQHDIWPDYPPLPLTPHPPPKKNLSVDLDDSHDQAR